MARGIGDIEGWPSVALVAGMGAGLILSAGVLWLRARWLRDQSAVLPSYRTVGTPASYEASNARALAWLLIGLCVVSELLYVGVYIELGQWLLGAKEPPRIVGDIFFWVLLINGTCAGASLYTGWKSR